MSFNLAVHLRKVCYLKHQTPCMKKLPPWLVGKFKNWFKIVFRIKIIVSLRCMKFKFILIHFLLDEVEIQFQNFDFFVEIIVCTLLFKKKSVHVLKATVNGDKIN
jgi:hypothetical protein